MIIMTIMIIIIIIFQNPNVFTGQTGSRVVHPSSIFSTGEREREIEKKVKECSFSKGVGSTIYGRQQSL